MACHLLAASTVVCCHRMAGLVLREVEQRLRVGDRMAACLVDAPAPNQFTHTFAAIRRFRLLMIPAGYEDGNDTDMLRGDPMFKMALDLSPSDRELYSQPTIFVDQQARSILQQLANAWLEIAAELERRPLE
jgi:hypothetical protein